MEGGSTGKSLKNSQIYSGSTVAFVRLTDLEARRQGNANNAWTVVIKWSTGCK